MDMRHALAIACLAGTITACTRTPSSPEQVVRETVGRAAQAAEQRDLAALREIVSAGYRDPQGYDRDGVLQLARAVLLAHRSVHLVTRVKAVAFPASNQATVSVITGMAGARVAADRGAGGLAADLYRFEVNFAEEAPGAWRVTSAHWQPAALAEAL